VPVEGPSTAGLYLRHWVCILLALVILVGLLLVPLPAVPGPGGEPIVLSSKGRASLAVVALCLTLWISEALPFAVTGLAAFLLFPAFGVASPTEVIASGMGHPLMLFFLGLFLISIAFVRVGLGHRIGHWMLGLSGGRSSRLILITLGVGALLAMGITSLAAASVMMGIAQEILEQSGLNSQRSDFGRSLLIATCWGPMIGSLGTPAGAGSNQLVIGYLRELAGVEVTFLDWMTLGMPAALLMVLMAWLILRWVFPTQRETLLSLTELERLETKDPNLMTRREWIVLIISGATLALWIAGPAIEGLTGGRVVLSLQNVGLAAALVLFLPGLDLISWSDAENDIHWGALWVLAGGLAAGLMLYRSGAARWLAWMLLGPLGSVAPLPCIFATIGAVLLLRMLFSSSTAAAAILMPLIIVLAQDLHIAPWLFSAPAALAANLAFIFPAQAAVHLVSYSAGQFTTQDMAKGGILLTLVAACVLGGVVLILGAATGLYRLR